jgi:hypothetical protein
MAFLILRAAGVLFVSVGLAVITWAVFQCVEGLFVSRKG